MLYSIFLFLPKNVIQYIAILVATLNPYGPPSTFLALILTCKTVQKAVLGPRHRRDDYVLATIARDRFDISAAMRRLGRNALSCSSMAKELTIRVPALARVRRGIAARLRNDLWVVYIMCIENDFFNLEQLSEARVSAWVAAVILSSDEDDERGGFVETEVLQLALAIHSYLVVDRVPPCLHWRVLDAISKVAWHFAFSCKRPISLLPEGCLQVNDQTLLALGHPTMGIPGVAVPITPPNPFWGQIVKLSLPPTAISSIICICPGIVRRFWHVRDCRCRLRSRHFDADFWKHALSHEAMTQIHPVVQREYMERIFESMDPQDPVVCEAVRRFYVFLTSPYTDASLGWCWSGVGRLWSIGALTGTWQGAFVFPLDPPPFPNRAYTAPENLTFLPLHLTIREHVNTVPSTHVKCPTLPCAGSLQYAWFPGLMEYVDQADVVPGVRLMYEVTEVVDGREQGFLYVRDRHDGEQEKRYHTVERSGSRWDVTAEMPCPGGWPVFESAQNGPGERDDQEDGECNRKSKDRNEGESGKADVIITGESHPFEDGTVPIPCRIFGRIRSTDGLVVFRLVIQYDCISSPRKARRPELAFVFRGYLVGGMALVGRWRAASTNMQDPRMYDGPFYLCKVEPTDG